jgi:ribosomal protein S10
MNQLKYCILLETFSYKNLDIFIKNLFFFINNKMSIYNLKTFFTFEIISLPKVIKKYTLIKSPHVNKKSREQFETIIYKKKLYINTNIKLTKKSTYLLFICLKQFLNKLSSTSFIKFKLFPCL